MKHIIRNEADRDNFIKIVSNAKLNRAFVGEFKQHRKKRTVNMNSLYWLWIAVVSEETGHTRDEIHSYNKQKFLLPQFKIIMGNKVRVEPSTTTLDTKEMSVFMDSFNLEFGEMGICLPRPEDKGYEEMEVRYGK